MQKRYPFKFLDAYTKEDSDIFFGREEEIAYLYEMVFQTDLLLIYGASGTGKTSLIQCGLASKFQSHDWLALYIRRGSNLLESFQKVLQDAGGSPEEQTDDNREESVIIYINAFKTLNGETLDKILSREFIENICASGDLCVAKEKK